MISFFGITPVAALYEVSHSTLGREGTTLAQDLTLVIEEGKVVGSMIIPDCEGKTVDEAIARMALWLRRLADGLENRTGTISIPLN